MMIRKNNYKGKMMNSVNKTLYIPLYGKAYVSKSRENCPGDNIFSAFYVAYYLCHMIQ